MADDALATDAEPQDGSVEVAFTRDGTVATVMLGREAKLNALTLAMLDQLERACRTIDDSDARVVVVRTSGDRVFCVGADINHFAGLSPAAMLRLWTSRGHRAFQALASLRQPSIAVVDGLAVGGGFELALACDLRVASVEARFGLPETGLGAVPGWAGTGRLVGATGLSRAKDLVLTRRLIEAKEAFDWGIVNRLAPATGIESAVDLLVEEILGSAPLAAQMAKQLLDAAANGASTALLEGLASAAAVTTDDFAEGLAAFREKRTPTFTDG